MSTNKKWPEKYRSAERIGELWTVDTNTIQFWMSLLALSTVLVSVFWESISGVLAMVNINVPQEIPFGFMLFFGIIGVGLLLMAIGSFASLMFLFIKSFFKVKQVQRSTYESVKRALADTSSIRELETNKVTFNLGSIKITLEGSKRPNGRNINSEK